MSCKERRSAMKKHILAPLIALTLLAPLAAGAEEMDEDRIKALVYEAIRENPGIVMEAVRLLEEQQQRDQSAAAAAALSGIRDELEQDPNAPVLGNPDGDVTVVEFFDYNCPYCRRAMPQVDALIEQDKNVRLVYREWPILGDGSVFAARAALAAREQGKYEEFHEAMMGMNGRAEEASVLRIAGEVGLDIEQLRRDMQAPEVSEHIETSMELTRALGFTGTPSFVIGDTLVGGLVEAEVLAEHVQTARDAQQ
ncbi:Disulfide bond formation protein D precursor [Marinovum algicola]|jgi:protein-disulfide isomerase|uniref:Protein-disulfide isomerase n=3 Tax=Roseobacteraceae TaxID=2854170 RepID=A0A975WB62_9RHOB|nr:Protein-disulfide isomerase [Marinovum algicola DG 898]SEJ71557.1 Protein-disulfide isomerase [Marinovum algicola]SLN55095.1 Disulfide bond formation protein D precursor [Marinovum algicola]